ncbi:Uncharacterised protein [Klebsiella pneumoniae]|nr:Uncharacterised protein [Klebsiella pneumoniae]
MTVEQNDFRYLMPGQLTGTTQAKHVFGVLPLALVADLRLAGKERLKAFTLQAFENGDGRDVGITV